MENSTLLTEKPIRGRSGAAADTGLLDISHIKGTVYTVPNNTRGGFSPRPKDEFLKKDKSFIRNVITNMNQKVFTKDDVSDIIKTGVTSYLNQNKDIGVKDLLTKKSRQDAGNKLKSTLKSTVLKTGQNVITHLQNNEYQWEDQAQFDKLVTAVRGSSSASKLQKAKCLKIAGKIRGMSKCESRVMNTSSIEKSGPTIDVEATEVKDKKKEDKKKNGAIVKSKGSDLANRGNKNTEVKDKRDPKTYRNKKGEGVKVPWKKVRSAARKGAEAAGRIAKSAVGAATAGYGQSSFSEEVSRRHKPSAIRKQKKLEKALSTLKYKKEKMVK